MAVHRRYRPRVLPLHANTRARLRIHRSPLDARLGIHRRFAFSVRLRLQTRARLRSYRSPPLRHGICAGPEMTNRRRPGFIRRKTCICLGTLCPTRHPRRLRNCTGPLILRFLLDGMMKVNTGLYPHFAVSLGCGRRRRSDLDPSGIKRPRSHLRRRGLVRRLRDLWTVSHRTRRGQCRRVSRAVSHRYTHESSPCS